MERLMQLFSLGLILMCDVTCRPGARTTGARNNARSSARNGARNGQRSADLNPLDVTEEETRELWLDDFTKDYLYEMQGDSPAGGSTCPPPPENVAPWACKAVTCLSDGDCRNSGERCCNNGCRRTCMASVHEPPVLDWIREPPRILKSGFSWLVPLEDGDNKGSNSVEWCSTSILDKDQDALLCRHGYQCHIEAVGDPLHGIPNRGRCVKRRKQAKDSRYTFRLKTSPVRTGLCFFKGQEIEEGEEFTYHKYPCRCIDGSIECLVRDERGT